MTTDKLYTAAEDICSLCGQSGADKIPMPRYWPGQERPSSEFVHAECEDLECQRARAELTEEQREEVLKQIMRHG